MRKFKISCCETDYALPEGDFVLGTPLQETKMDQLTLLDTVMLTELETWMIVNQRQDICSKSVVKQSA